MPDTDDGRVTLAVLGEKLDSLKELVIKSNDDTKQWREKYSQRLEDVEKCIIKMQQIQSTGMTLLGGVSLMLSVVAAYIGSRF